MPSATRAARSDSTAQSMAIRKAGHKSLEMSASAKAEPCQLPIPRGMSPIVSTLEEEKITNKVEMMIAMKLAGIWAVTPNLRATFG